MSEANGHSHSGHANGHGNGAGYESREASVKLVLQSVAGLFITVIIVCAIVVGIFKLFEKTIVPEANTSPIAPPTSLPPGPHVEEHPYQELKGLHSREDLLLNSYGWIDQKSGVVHIPIDKAIDQVVATLPVRPQPATGSQQVAQAPRSQQGGSSANPR